MRYLNSLDYAVIGMYAAFLTIMGLYLWRKASQSMDHYFLAGRNLPWWALGVSGMTNFLDMSGTMIIVAFLYMLGPRGLFVEFRGGAVLVLPFMLLWTGKWHYRSKCMTGAEWQIYRFGTGTGAQFARIITAFSGIIVQIGMLAYLIIGTGVFLSMFLPFSPIVCAIMMVGLTTLYTVVSGFYGVVYNDLFQASIILLCVVIISVMAMMKVFSYEGNLGALAHQVTGNAEWMSSVPHWQTFMPKGYEDFRFLQFLMFFYLLRNIMAGLGSGADQRYFGARNERECGVLTFFWTWLMTFRWPMMMGFAVLGIFLVKTVYPDVRVLKESEIVIKQYLVEQKHPGFKINVEKEQAIEAVVPKKDWEKVDKIITNPEAYPEIASGLNQKLGDGWKEQFKEQVKQEKIVREVIPKNRWEEALANIVQSPEKYAAIGSQLQDPKILGEDWMRKVQLTNYEGNVNAERILPAVILMNIPMGLRGLFIASLLAAAMSTLAPLINMTTAFFTKDIYQAYVRSKASNTELIAASYGFSVLLVVAGFIMAYQTKNINDIWDWITMGLGAGLAVPAILRLYWWRFNAAGVFWGLLVGLTAAVAQRLYFSFLHPELTDWAPWTKFTILTVVSLIGAIIGTYTSPPTDRKVLEHFYRTTRPFGFWGPLKASLSPQVRAAVNRENFYDIITVPFALLWQVCLFLLPMQMVIGAWQSFIVTLILFVIGLGGVMIFWYRNLPSKEIGQYEASRLLVAEDEAHMVGMTAGAAAQSR